MAVIQRDFVQRYSQGWIQLEKSDLTAKFCPHPDRRGALTTRDLYNKLIPRMIREGSAVLLEKEGKKVTYGFRQDD